MEKQILLPLYQDIYSDIIKISEEKKLWPSITEFHKYANKYAAEIFMDSGKINFWDYYLLLNYLNSKEKFEFMYLHDFMNHIFYELFSLDSESILMKIVNMTKEKVSPREQSDLVTLALVNAYNSIANVGYYDDSHLNITLLVRKVQSYLLKELQEFLKRINCQILLSSI